MIRESAPAKINLALHVRHRRPDGYHELETLFAFATDGDMVSVEAADANRFAITGPFAAALLPAAQISSEHPLRHAELVPASTVPREHRPESVRLGGPRIKSGVTAWGGNLVTAAADAFVAAFAIDSGHSITLEKNLPIASGIGGGSADAAATLRALAKLHAIPINDPRFAQIAETLGADVPACLLGRTTLGTGKGETLVEIPGLPGTPLLLVNPGVAVPTGPVFAGWDGEDRGAIPSGDLLARARAARNDLEPPARAIAPVIAEVRALLDASDGLLLARMSGSGATCFALFDTPAHRSAAAAWASARGWWCLETALA